MRLTTLALLGVVLGAMGCNNPIAPTHYLCVTQPRWYTDARGVGRWETDHYVQATPCPAKPID